MLMNGKEVNHLVISGETFDKSYYGKKVQLLNDVYLDSGITYDNKYYYGGYGGIFTKGREGFIILLKHLNFYYICCTLGADKIIRGAWCKEEDIKILD